MGKIFAQYFLMICIFLIKSSYMKDASRLTELVEKLIPYEESIEKLSEVATMLNINEGEELASALVSLVEENKDLKEANESFVDVVSKNQIEIKQLSERIDKLESLISSLTQKGNEVEVIKENISELKNVVEDINNNLLSQTEKSELIKDDIKLLKINVESKLEIIEKDKTTKKAIEEIKASLITQAKDLILIKEDIEARFDDLSTSNTKQFEVTSDLILAHTNEFKSIKDEISLIKNEVEQKSEITEKDEATKKVIEEIKASLITQAHDLRLIKEDVEAKFDIIDKDSIGKIKESLGIFKADVDAKLKSNSKKFEDISDSLLAHTNEFKSIKDEISLIKNDVEQNSERTKKDESTKKIIEEIKADLITQAKDIKLIIEDIEARFDKIDKDSTGKIKDSLDLLNADVDTKLKSNYKIIIEKISGSLLAQTTELESIKGEISEIKNDVEPKTERTEKDEFIKLELEKLNDYVIQQETEYQSIKEQVDFILEEIEKKDHSKAEDDIIDKDKEERRKANKYTSIFNEQRVNVNQDFMKDLDLKAFTEAIADSTKTGILQMDNLSNNNEQFLKDEDFQQIANSLTKNSSIKYIYLNSSGLGDIAIQYLCKALETNNDIMHISLFNNQITDVGAKYIIDLKKINKKILISLKGNKISEDLMNEISNSQ